MKDAVRSYLIKLALIMLSKLGYEDKPVVVHINLKIGAGQLSTSLSGMCNENWKRFLFSQTIYIRKCKNRDNCVAHLMGGRELTQIQDGLEFSFIPASI